jgi:hypothetical protein
MLIGPRRNRLVHGASDMMSNIWESPSPNDTEHYLDYIGVDAVTIRFIPTMSILLPWIATDFVEPFFVYGDHVSIG